MYNNDAKVAILLATYNSANYLSEQLDSLYSQTYKDWHIFIHDDGSTDNTLDIINDYIAKYGKITVLNDDKKKLGATFNFVHILNNVDSRYYMFCDHDDVWLPMKVERAISEIQKQEKLFPESPIILHTDLILVDKDLNIISDSLWSYARISPKLLKEKRYGLVSSLVTGCTLAMNNFAKSQLAVNFPPDTDFLHDAWIGLQAIYAKNAIIISLEKSDILYRLHGKNESGVPKVGIKYYINRLTKSSDLFKDLNKKRKYLKYFEYGSLLKFIVYKISYNFKRK